MDIKKFAIYAMMAIAAFTSCKGTDPEEPEKPVVVADVLFSADNGDYCYYAAPGQTTEITLKLIRSGNTEEDTYDITVVTATAGLVIPETVTFPAGSSEAVIKISTPADGQALGKYDFDIKLEGKNVNASASSTDGTLRCEGTVYIYEEITAVGQLGGSDKREFSYLGNFKQKVWKLADNKYIFKDFLGGGDDLAITYGSDFVEYYGYELLSMTYSDPDYNYIYKYEDEEGTLDYHYFCHYDEASDSWDYRSFYPKGEQRYITDLSLVRDWSYYYKTEKSDYIYFTVKKIGLYGESEQIETSLDWVYYLYFYLNKNVDDYDCVGFPEVIESPYPEADLEPEIPDGYMAMNMYMYYDKFDLDTQVAKAVETEGGVDYVIEDFMQSGHSLTIHTLNGSYAVTVDVSDDYGYYDENDDAYYFYSNSAESWDYFYPWASDINVCLSSLSIEAYSSSEDNYYTADYNTIYLSISYQLYMDGGWQDTTYDYLELYWD